MRVAPLLLAIGLLGSPWAWACGPLRAAYLIYPGLYERQRDGQEQGMDVDLLAELQRRTGCSVQAVPHSTQRAWQQLEEGELDLVMSALLTPERERLAEFALVGNTRELVVLRADAGRRLASAEDFLQRSALRLITVRGARHGPHRSAWIEALRARGRVSEASDMAAALRAFEAGRGDALLAFPMALAQRPPEWWRRNAVRDWWPEEQLRGGMALSLRSLSGAERARLRQAMDAMAADGSLRRMADKHLGPELAALFVTRP